MKRRLLAFLLAFVMTFSLVPVNAFALESSGEEVTASAEDVKTEAAKTTTEPAALLADDEVPVTEQAEEDIKEADLRPHDSTSWFGSDL